MVLPTNLLMKRIGANVTLPVMAALLGLVGTCQGSHFPLVLPFLALTRLGAVHSYHGLLVCRFVLGTLEGIIHHHGSFPILIRASSGGLSSSILLLLSSFYKRHALQLRFAMMFGVTSLAHAFSGLLAFGIHRLDGKHGIAAWRWIFIIVRVHSI